MQVIRNKRVLSRNVLPAFASTIISSLISVISAPLIAYLLSPQDLGMMRYVLSITTFIISLSAPGTANSISFSVAKGYEGDFKLVTWHRLKIYLRNSIVLVPIAALYLLQNNYDLAIMLIASAFISPWAYAFDTVEQLLIGRSDFISLFWRRIIVTAIISFSGVIIALALPKAASVFIGKQLISFILLFSVYKIAEKSIKNTNRDPAFWKRTNDFNLVSRLIVIGNTLDRLLLGATGMFETLALYSVATSVNLPFELFSRTFQKLLYKKMSNKLHQRTKQIWLVLSFALIIIGLFFSFVLPLILLPLIKIIYPKYIDIIYLLPFFIMTTLFGFVNVVPYLYVLFHHYSIWNSHNIRRSVLRIPTMAIATVLYNVWGALIVNLIFSIVDYVVYLKVFMKTSIQEATH